jgi:c(7)-type cytochrome triheme protein
MKGGEEMKKAVIIMIVAVALAFAGIAYAVPKGKTVVFTDGSLGKVTFDGTVHAEKGLKCNDCHTKIFPMKKEEGKFTMKDMQEGKACGACHNGEKAFSVKGDCGKCHKK